VSPALSVVSDALFPVHACARMCNNTEQTSFLALACADGSMLFGGKSGEPKHNQVPGFPPLTQHHGMHKLEDPAAAGPLFGGAGITIHPRAPGHALQPSDLLDSVRAHMAPQSVATLIRIGNSEPNFSNSFEINRYAPVPVPVHLHVPEAVPE
jgi:hypothetical protein